MRKQIPEVVYFFFNWMSSEGEQDSQADILIPESMILTTTLRKEGGKLLI